MVFSGSLSDSKSPQVSRTCLGILAVLSNAVIWKISTRPPTSKYSLTVSHRSLSDSKSPQVSWPLLRILADLNNTVVWIVSSRSLIFKSSSLFINPLVTVPRAPVTIGITINFMFYSFFSFLARSWYFSLFSHFFCCIILWSVERFFFFTITR